MKIPLPFLMVMLIVAFYLFLTKGKIYNQSLAITKPGGGLSQKFSYKHEGA